MSGETGSHILSNQTRGNTASTVFLGLAAASYISRCVIRSLTETEGPVSAKVNAPYE